MKMIALPIAILLFASASFTGWRLSRQPGSWVVGGEYVVHSGELVSGNVQALFAQVTLEEGARIDGRILSVSSALDLAGTVSGEIVAFGSDVQVRDTASLRLSPRELHAIPYVVLLPSNGAPRCRWSKIMRMGPCGSYLPGGGTGCYVEEMKMNARMEATLLY